jgi:hypothetical protein
MSADEPMSEVLTYTETRFTRVLTTPPAQPDGEASA